MGNSGIYSITNIQNKKRYIGSAINFRNRWNEHKRNLRKNSHHNPHLQNAWNKHKEKNFAFETLEIVLISNIELLRELEQYYLEAFEPEYNILHDAANPQ